MSFFNKLPYIGWLSPDGTLHKVDAFNHVEFARKVCEDAGLETYEAYFRPDGILLSNGWVQIQASMGTYHAFWNKKLTYEQFTWMQEKIDNECPDDWHERTKLSFDLER